MFRPAVLRVAVFATALVALCSATARPAPGTAVGVDMTSNGTARIVGGGPLPHTFARYVARIEVLRRRLSDGRRISQLCTGVVTSPSTVLTAARCFVQRGQGQFVDNNVISVKVYVGLENTQEKTSWDETYEADEVYMHRQYGEVVRSTLTSNYDLAVIFLDDDLPDNHPTVALADYDLRKNNKVFVSGWGKINAARTVNTDVLRFTKLRMRPFGKCHKALPDSIKDRFNPRSVLCASAPAWRRGGKSICAGDQGAPLFTVRNGRMTVHGIALSTPACGAPRTGQFFSYVNNFRASIEDIVSETDFSQWRTVYQ